MSSVVSGIGKVFNAVGSTVAKVSSSVGAIGKAAFATTAATAAPSIGQGGLSFASQLVAEQGGNVLSQVLGNASKVSGVQVNQVTPTATPTLMNPQPTVRNLEGFSGGLSGGLSGASQQMNTFQRAPQSISAPQAQAPAMQAPIRQQGISGGLSGGQGGNNFLSSVLNSPLTGSVLEGLGGAMEKRAEQKFLAGEKRKEREFAQKKIDDVRDSYKLDSSVYNRSPRRKARVSFEDGIIESR